MEINMQWRHTGGLVSSMQACLLPLLHEILVKCWREGKVPQDMRDAKVITLYKKKDFWSDCNNHREISLFDIADKAFAYVTLPHL